LRRVTLALARLTEGGSGAAGVPTGSAIEWVKAGVRTRAIAIRKEWRAHVHAVAELTNLIRSAGPATRAAVVDVGLNADALVSAPREASRARACSVDTLPATARRATAPTVLWVGLRVDTHCSAANEARGACALARSVGANAVGPTRV
jgi:hypothetical protein